MSVCVFRASTQNTLSLYLDDRRASNERLMEKATWIDRCLVSVAVSDAPKGCIPDKWRRHRHRHHRHHHPHCQLAPMLDPPPAPSTHHSRHHYQAAARVLLFGR